MKFTTASVLFTLFALFGTLCSVIAAPVVVRDVFVPPITSPTPGSTFTRGENITVTWSLDYVPEHITNPNGLLVLAQPTADSENLDLDNPLASGFSILTGSVEITWPTTIAAGDYSLVLFGDSGNIFGPYTLL